MKDVAAAEVPGQPERRSGATGGWSARMGVSDQRDSRLAQVRQANGAFPLILRRRQSGQEQCCEYGNDGDNHQQLDQREGTRARRFHVYGVSWRA